MTLDDDLHQAQQDLLTQRREVLVSHGAILPFEKGLTEVIVRGEHGTQKLKVNQDELRDIAMAALHYLAKFGDDSDDYQYALRLESGLIVGEWMDRNLTQVLRAADHLPGYTPVRRLWAGEWTDIPR